jgi:hypothetical protein
LTVEACGTTKTAKATVVIKHAKPKPFGFTTVIGRQVRSHIPFTGRLRATASFEAHLEPQVKEFRLTSSTGTMEPGMKKFPFCIVFAPKEPRAVVVLLVVVFDEDTVETEKYTVKITGGVGWFQGRSRPRRKYGGRFRPSSPRDLSSPRGVTPETDN